MGMEQIIDVRKGLDLRGDPMNGERYYSPEFARLEWEHMWKKVWHVAGRVNELEEPGDYIVHDFMHESVIVVMQDDRSLKAFFNSCMHRGQRLVSGASAVKNFHCPYHGWVYGRDGVVTHVNDPETFPQGNPCGKLKLRETRCDTWGGFVWYAMSDAAPSFAEFLGPIAAVYRNFPMDTLVRAFWMKIDLNTNWKFAPENFSESYHTRTAHPQVPAFADQDYWTAREELYPQGHSRIVHAMRPSFRDNPWGEGPHPFDAMLRAWELDPAAYPDFKTKVMQGWKDIKAAKRRLWRERGYKHYEHLDDEQISESLHTQLFPNVTLTFAPDALFFQRTEPHPADPNKCTFDEWCLVYPVEGKSHTDTPMVGKYLLPIREAEFQHRAFDGGRGVPELEGGVVIQDLLLAESQQRGVHSQGYKDAYLSGQESRVRLFNEIINDYIAGRR
jgi:phenylpropionate dioxygenase-like ring-hydroxylating dioxygenase large terminal subunit